MKISMMTVLMLLGIGTHIVRAQDAASGAGDEAAIRAVGEACVAAFNKGDADALARYWSPGAVYVNRITGDRVVQAGRSLSAVIEPGFSRRFRCTSS
jgi:hypothetical protein